VPPAGEPARPHDNRPHRVAIAAHVRRVSNGRAVVTLTCPSSATGTCAGTLVLHTATRVSVAGGRRILELGRTRYSIARGTSRSVKVTLARATGRIADRKGHVRVIAVASGAGASAISLRHLTLTVRK
jgi:hypothetical protein